MVLCLLAALNAWGKVAESGKRLEPFPQIMQSTKETFPDFFAKVDLNCGKECIRSSRKKKDNNLVFSF